MAGRQDLEANTKGIIEPEVIIDAERILAGPVTERMEIIQYQIHPAAERKFDGAAESEHSFLIITDRIPPGKECRVELQTDLSHFFGDDQLQDIAHALAQAIVTIILVRKRVFRAGSYYHIPE